MKPPPSVKSLVLAMWGMWFGLVCAIPIYQVFLGGGWLEGRDARSPFSFPATWIAVALLMGAGFVRWRLMPGTRNPQLLLVFLMIGMGLSEAGAVVSIFLLPRDMPETKMTLWALSFVSALLFVPMYTKGMDPGQREAGR